MYGMVLRSGIIYGMVWAAALCMQERHYVWDGMEERHDIWDGMGSGIMYGGAALCMVPYGAAAKKAGE